MADPRQSRSHNPCKLETICLYSIIRNFIKTNGKYVKDKVNDMSAANKRKRKRGDYGDHFFRTVFMYWKKEMESKILSDSRELNLPVFLSQALSSKCLVILDHVFNWIYQNWNKFPLTPDINLCIFQFENLYWKSNGTIHDRKTYVSHLCYILAHETEVMNCIKKRYPRTYNSVFRLMIVHFEMKIHEKYLF